MSNLKVMPGTDPVPVENDGKLIISTGKSRFETKWRNTSVLWSKLLKKLGHSIETPETSAEYSRMGKEKQDRIKDIGGFVGGHLKGGRRRNGYVEARQILTLDVDFPPKDLWGELTKLIDSFDLNCAFAVYSTHKHTENKPRLRIIIPLDRTVTPDEYEAIARKIAEKIGIDYFDDSTFQPTRLMYWPSHSIDVKPFFNYYDAPFLEADSVLNEYPDWTDTSYWPMSSRVADIRRKAAEKAGDPLSKPGLIGAFNQAYDIHEAIAEFLPDVYTQTAKEDRYTYSAGSTAAGLVVYEDGLFAYSNHSTDPAGGKLCNAFDLVRIHRFGDMDKDAPEGTPVAKLASFKEMQRFVQSDDKVSLMLADQAAKRAFEDFAPLEDGEDWRTKLTRKKNGDVEPTLKNALVILTYDRKLASMKYNEFADTIEASLEMPWERQFTGWQNRDTDHLYTYVANTYDVQFPTEQFNRAITAATGARHYHPVKDYLSSLPAWDGVPRVDTLLIDYLGAEDNIFVREATRKTLTAAVARMYQPGIKFDCMLVPVGDQGIGKSTLFARLAGSWVSDSLTMTDMRDKTGAEKLQGYWILEVGEMAGMRKAEIESVKSFISRSEDIYRPAYGRHVERHPRQCIIVGSTNAETGFLRDITGNRRFWPVRCKGGKRKPWHLSSDEIAQIWAEVKAIYEGGELLLLSPEAEAIARNEQQKAMEDDPRRPQVEKYLDTLLPDDWDSMSLLDRRSYLDDEDGFYPEGKNQRETVSNIEIWCECFGGEKSDIKRRDADEITALMMRVNGWERDGKQKRIPLYGKQRIYIRNERNEDF